MRKALSKLKILFWLFPSLNFWTPVSQDDDGILKVFGPENTLIQGFLLELMSWSSVCDPGLMICLFLRIPGVTFASKVGICRLVMFCPTRPKPAYGRQGLAGSWGQDTDEVSTMETTLKKHGNQPPLVQKTWRHSRGGPTDLLWCKKRDVTHGGVQLTF